MIDLPPADMGCHLTGFTKKCRALVSKGTCKRWITIQGSDPQTGAAINRSDCVDNFAALLALENGKLQRETAAAVESFRNEMLRLNGVQPGAAQQLEDKR